MTIHPKKYTYKNFIDTIDFSEIQKTMESMNIQLQQLTVNYPSPKGNGLQRT